MKQIIIGFTGNIGSGKSTAAAVLVRELGFVKMNFKDALLVDVAKRFPDLLREMNSYYRHKDNTELLAAYPRPPLVRALLQNYGTNVRRGDDKNYWVERWRIEVEGRGYERVVVDDVRFPNEAEAIQLLMDGKVIRINGKVEVTQFATHASETEMTKIAPNFSINNHGLKHDFEMNVLERVREALSA